VGDVCWVADHWDDVVSDWSAIHRKDPEELEAMTAREFWPRTLRLVHYQGAVRDIATARIREHAEPPPTEHRTSAPDTAALNDPTPEQVRALRDAARRKRYPAEKFGEMKYVTESDIVREAGRNA
jgi:hypothetical protein